MTHPPAIGGPRLLRALHYFEAVARLGSVVQAAAETGVSPSAVSHQIRDLSATLGEELFVKDGRGLALTDAGRGLAERLGATFADLDAMLADVVGRRTRALRLAVCSSFGPAWLAPRLPDLARACPGLELELRLYAQDPEQSHAVADAIVTAMPPQGGFEAIDLFDETLVAVQSPASPPDVARRLVTTEIAEGGVGRDWDAYCALTGMRREDLGAPGYLRCTHYLLALGVAASGLGVALVPDFLAADALGSGALVPFDRARLPSGRVYRLCYKRARAGDPDLRALARWMRSQRRVDPPRREAARAP